MEEGDGTLEEVIMADINVQRKRPGILPVIVALLVLGVLAWLGFTLADGGEREGTAGVEAPARAAPGAGAPAAEHAALVVVDPVRAAAAVQGYVAHVRGAGEARMGRDHRYTAEGIARLATALREIAQAQRGLTPATLGLADGFYRTAAALVTTPDSLRLHADWMHQAAASAAAVMEAIVEGRSEASSALHDQVADVRNAAAAIQPGKELLAQGDEVRRFFREAVDPLQMLVSP